MRDLRRLLVEGDPVAREQGLSDADARAMRQAILVEARRQPVVGTMASWPRPLALAAALAACLVIGIGLGMRLSDEQAGTTSTLVRPVAPAARETVRRQLQFASPGGTRIIWTFQEN